MSDDEAAAWGEYERAAAWCAAGMSKWMVGDSLPSDLSPAAAILIDDDPEAFEKHVRGHAYAAAMLKVEAAT